MLQFFLSEQSKALNNLLNLIIMKKFILSIGTFLGVLGSASAAIVNDAAAVNTAATTLVGQAETLFDLAVPITLAVVGLSILLHFVKKVRKS